MFCEREGPGLSHRKRDWRRAGTRSRHVEQPVQPHVAARGVCDPPRSHSHPRQLHPLQFKTRVDDKGGAGMQCACMLHFKLPIKHNRFNYYFI